MKNKKVYQVILVFIFIFFLFIIFTSNIPKISKYWETDKILQEPESISYDSDRNYFYVSNINGSPSIIDHNGYISLIGLDGKILSKKWIDNLDAPKGIIYKNDKIYFTDIRKVVIADAQTAEILNIIQIKGSVFLNDIVISDDNILFVSDTATGIVFKISPNLDVSKLPGTYSNVNGLFLKNSFLYIGADKSLIKYDLTTGNKNIIASDLGNIDGLYVYSDSEFLYSYSKTLKYFLNGKIYVLANGLHDNGWYADFIISILNDRTLLILPTLAKSVICYQIY